ncbi:MAG: LD-carboxypeptidase [Defluviitaleaceae bacterium]|nr:LD-carboxypeptidase [Defluviitaleaceae bacterium]
MTIPSPLKPGDKVGLIAPAGPLPKDAEEQACRAIKKLKLVPVIGKYANQSTGYLAGNDHQRAWDFNNMFADNEIKGIICLKGGYGTIRILNKIDWSLPIKNPKVFVGYSDITALHIALNQRCGLVTYHGPMAAIELIKEIDEASFTSLENHIFGKKNDTYCFNLGEYPIKTIVKGSFSGRLTGGNLATIVSTLGTPYEINTVGAVLFLEDIDEPPYKIDRMITQMEQCGKFKELAGIVLGDFTDADCNRLPIDHIAHIMESLGVPCVYGLPCGHTLPNITLPLGVTAKWDSL